MYEKVAFCLQHRMLLSTVLILITFAQPFDSVFWCSFLWDSHLLEFFENPPWAAVREIVVSWCEVWPQIADRVLLIQKVKPDRWASNRTEAAGHFQGTKSHWVWKHLTQALVYEPIPVVFYNYAICLISTACIGYATDSCQGKSMKNPFVSCYSKTLNLYLHENIRSPVLLKAVPV